MRKNIFETILISIIAMMMVMPSFAATSYEDMSNPKIVKRTTTAITYKDFRRFEEVATKVRGKEAKIVNAAPYNGSKTTWVIRLNFGTIGDQCSADFIVNVYPYIRNDNTKDGHTIGFENYPWNEKKIDGTDEIAAGCNKFGPCWYYFGLFDDNTHNICGFAVAERFNRWPEWNRLSYSGTSYRGIWYNGSFDEPCSNDFIKEHSEIK